MVLFCQCENNTDSDDQSIFIFPEIENIGTSIYDEIKKTCETYWDLSRMFDTTFEIINNSNEYLINCEGKIDGVLYQFFIRVDKYGKWINDGRLIIEY
jgi:hypothetical protein